MVKPSSKSLKFFYHFECKESIARDDLLYVGQSRARVFFVPFSLSLHIFGKASSRAKITSRTYGLAGATCAGSELKNI